jgi:beta-N-acetylhexosaminidase
MGLVCTLQGVHVSDEEADLLTSSQIDGIIIFRKNIADLSQLKKLCREVKSINKNLIIGIDHEGGRISRVDKFLPKTRTPLNLGSIYESAPKTATILMELEQRIYADVLSETGITHVLGPCVDRNLSSCIISNYQRSYHQEPEIVINLASSFIEAFNKVGITPVIKHYPGHGAALGDTHLSITWDPRNIELIEQDIFVFEQLIQKYSFIEVMLSHVSYKAADGVPASISDYWYRRLLNTTKSSEKIWSDCLAMKAIPTTIRYNLKKWLKSYRLIYAHQSVDFYKEILT